MILRRIIPSNCRCRRDLFKAMVASIWLRALPQICRDVWCCHKRSSCQAAAAAMPTTIKRCNMLERVHPHRFGLLTDLLTCVLKADRVPWGRDVRL
eukprot:6190972-Pleurochrysis_carterae.AAC.1